MIKCSILPNLPNVGDLLVVKIAKVGKEWIEAELIEYGNIKGIINFSELSKRRVKNISHITKKGRFEVCKVIQIEGDNIDLSLKKVDADEKEVAMKARIKNRIAYQIVSNAAHSMKKEVEELYLNKCYKEIENHGTLFKYFVDLKKRIPFNSDDEYERAFIDIIVRDYTLKEFDFRADVSLTCLREDGLLVIKSSLKKAKEFDSELEINLLSSPIYSITKTFSSREEGLYTMDKALELVKTCMERSSGCFELLRPPSLQHENMKSQLLKEDVEFDEFDEDFD